MHLCSRLPFAALLVALIGLAGCQSSSNPNTPATVHGKVTYNGSTVPGGFVFLHFEDGSKMQAAIGADGSYSAETKEGTYVLTVETESLNPGKKEEYRGQGAAAAKGYGKYGGGGGGGGVPKGKGMPESPTPEGVAKPEYVKIPSKYADKAASGLTVTLKPGKTKFDINLTD
jgi:hypothetical protein